jgi:hypothetical protein
MNELCPITDRRTDEYVTRINALITVALAVIFIIFDLWILLAILAVDFAVRGFFDSKYSIICTLSKTISNTLGLAKKPINAGPKMFAAQIGMVLSVFALFLFAFECSITCKIVAGMLSFFAVLEGVFGICVACRIYPIFRKIS